MEFYVGVCFKKKVQDAVINTLEQFDFPTACFSSSIEEYACIKEAGCYHCGSLVTGFTSTEDDYQDLYCFVEAEKEVCKKLWSVFIDLEGVQLAFFADGLDNMFEKYMQPICTECKKLLVNPQKPSAKPAEPPAKKTRMSLTEIITNVRRNGIVPAPTLRVLLEGESDPYNPGTRIQQGAPDPNSTVHFQGDFNSLCSSNPEYQWTKCKLCMRILRTKRCDASRMRTLQTSHARNHVSRFQYACKLCSFGCRFHGGIQLHMTRMHPGSDTYYMDRSKDSRYRAEIANMVVTCFGQDARSSKGSKRDLYNVLNEVTE